MSEDTPQPWWVAKESSLARKKVAAAGRAACAKPGDSFLIVTEGEVTECVYFEQLRAALQLSAVKILPGRTSDPRDVIETAAAKVREQTRRVRRDWTGENEVKYDHVWAVIDTDAAERARIWPEVLALAEQRKVRLGASTPCFEVWLLLHFGYTTRPLRDGAAAKRAFEEALGRDYSTNVNTARAVMAGLIGKWPEAVAHAQAVRRHHTGVSSPSPANPSTGVDELVCALNDAALPHHRKLKG